MEKGGVGCGGYACDCRDLLDKYQCRCESLTDKHVHHDPKGGGRLIAEEEGW